MVGVPLAVLLRIPCEFPKSWHPGLFVILGLSMGSGVKPETLTQVHQWPISILIIFFTVFFIILATYFYPGYIAGWDKSTSYFASIPGALFLLLPSQEIIPGLTFHGLPFHNPSGSSS